jgi:FkbM family methyltransferase
MGNGADKILAVCERYGIAVQDFFASDGFVRGHSFHGMRVMSYSEVESIYPPDGCVVLLAFGSSRPEVMALFDRVAARYPLFVPDLPVCGENLFDAAFFARNCENFEKARALFSDEDSRTLFDLVLRCKYEAAHALFDRATSKCEAWDLLPAKHITAMADLGAYNGDTAREAMEKCPELAFVLAVEPDRRNFRKLSDWAANGTENCVIECHGVAISNTRGEAAFDASGNRNAGLCTGRTDATVATDTLDNLLGGRPIDYVKFDVEGAEHAALLGAAQSIRTHRPALRVAAYHRSEDLFDLPLLLAELCPDYDFHLVRTRGYPAWDLDIVAIPQ